MDLADTQWEILQPVFVETRLVRPTLDQTFAPHPPKKLLGDLAYDSDPLDQQLQQDNGIDHYPCS